MHSIIFNDFQGDWIKNANTSISKLICVLNADDYKYVWSLLHGRNTGISNLDYPNNYINAIKQQYNLNKWKYIVINATKDIKNRLELDGFIIEPFVTINLDQENVITS